MNVIRRSQLHSILESWDPRGLGEAMLAEPEGAQAPHGVGSHTRDTRELAVKLYDHCEYVFVDTPGFKDSVRRAEAKRHRADPAMLEEAQKVTGVPVWHLERSRPGSVGLERLPVILERGWELRKEVGEEREDADPQSSSREGSGSELKVRVLHDMLVFL
ncbi:hypothetical protein BKA83DRAFT_4486595 [Pisolithus microcarpus]|nr:hypothetical protein BKA83DRAFT_4486595 [Pisolithus microcarpus]